MRKIIQLRKMGLSLLVLICAGTTATAFAKASVKEQQPCVCVFKTEADRLLRQGQAGEAVRLYERCIEKNPENSAACFNLAIAHYQSGRWNEAQQALKKAVTLNPQDVEALYNLGCLCLYTGKIEEAKGFFEEAKAANVPESRFISRIESGLFLSEKCLGLDANSRKIVLAALLKQIV